jgi:putative transposase
MQVNRSGYYRHLSGKGDQPSATETRLLLEVKRIAQETRYSYGSRRMAKQLTAQGNPVGRYAARTLMRQAGIECRQRRRYQITTQSQHSLAVAENVLNREFSVAEPNRAWTTDITYLWTLEGWLYIAGVMDLFSRRVVGWAIAEHMRGTLVQEALQMAIGRRQPSQGLLHHSDRGVQYASHDYQGLLFAAGMKVSMSRRGNCWDNAAMERLWGSVKSERTDDQIYHTRKEAKADVIDYLEMFYNSKRLHSTLGYMSPMQFENQFLSKKVSTST